MSRVKNKTPDPPAASDGRLGISLEELLKQKTTGSSAARIGSPDRAESFFNEGVDLLKRGRYFDALGPLFAATALDPKHFKAANNLVVAFWQLNCPELARWMAEKILRLDPGNERAQQHLEILQDDGRESDVG